MKTSTRLLNKLQFKILVTVLSIITINLSVVMAKGVKKENEATLEGRWDLTVNIDGKERPSWLEVSHSGHHTLVGQYVSVSGSARPISKIILENGKFSFTIPPQWEPGNEDLVFNGSFSGNDINGTVLSTNGKTYEWKGVRAPAMRKSMVPSWGKSIKLFNAINLNGWHATGENQWKVSRGILRSAQSGSNIVTDEKFNDFKLHIEFRYDKGSNSGVYLRGRYEVQIADSKGMEPLKDQLGAVYGFIAPSEMVAKSPGEWQVYDITLIGRMVTVVANGRTIICNREIPGITGGALDSREGEPGPILLQGDHGPIDYRNIVITPSK